jgi:metallo-beta-lactamase family protein
MSVARLTFLGASETVTGSRYLVETDAHKVLVDCGLFQGERALREKNWERFPVDPNKISAVVITHAHIDHVGYLPVLVKGGFKGPIYTTPASDELTKILLADSAKLQEEEASYAEKVGSSRHTPPKPLYDREDAKRAVELIKTIPFYEYTEVVPGFKFLPRQAGHILGSSNLTLDVLGKRISFSGDVGRYNAPILMDPEGMELGDILLCESTYGDRFHGEGDLKTELLNVVRNAVLRKGPLIIPAFALGRTQTILYLLSELEHEGRIPALPIFVDSPMAADVSAIYKKHKNLYDAEAKATFNQDSAPLSTSRTMMCRTTQQSKEINGYEGTRIIISASGMVNGGRVLHHMLHNLPNPDTTVLFVGYQSPGTRGYAIQNGQSMVKIFGRNVPIQAHVETISGLSAHADKGELLRWLKSCSGTPGRVKIVHGEKEVAHSFAATVQTELGWKADAALQNEVVEI